jgi:transposase
MMGEQQPQKDLFSYHIDLDRRVRADHPLRRVAATVDFSFVRQEVEHTYGENGNVSVDPAVILKLMFLLFFEDVASERQLMRMLPERLDYLWFLGYGLDEEIPHHSVLSKARARWGAAVFESLFVRTVSACVAAGLVDGQKIHVDGSLIAAHASNDSVLSAAPEFIAALKATYRQQAAKLEEPALVATEPPPAGPINATHLSRTDPDAELASQPGQPSRPRYKLHRMVDDAHGVITAQVTTGGAVKEETQLMGLIEQHQHHTEQTVATVVADSGYGTVKNFVACQQRGLRTHMADLKQAQERAGQRQRFYPERAFVYEPDSDIYRCPAGRRLHRHQRRPEKAAWQYMARKGVCAACALRRHCTEAKHGRRIQRFEAQEMLEQGRAQAHSAAARADRRRRKHLMEGSFADAANQHGLKRARWRRLWRQRIQNSLIAACQNVRLLLRQRRARPGAAMAQKSLHAPISLSGPQWLLRRRNPRTGYESAANRFSTAGRRNFRVRPLPPPIMRLSNMP